MGSTQGSVKPRTFLGRDGKEQTRWRARLDLGPDPLTGKRRQKSKDHETRAEARKTLALWIAQPTSTPRSRASALCVKDACISWLETCARFKSPSTFINYETAVRLRIVPVLGSVPLSDLDTARCRLWITDMLVAKKTGYVLATLARVVLLQVLEQAVDDGLLPHNPLSRARLPADRTPKRERVVWTSEQARAFLAEAEKDSALGPIWLVALSSGLRLGELLGLRWRDISWSTHELCVRQQVGDVFNHPEVKDRLKSPSARRDVTVGESVISALRAWRSTQHEARLGAAHWEDNDLVFPRHDGACLDSRFALYHFHRAARRAGVPSIRIHDQRHTFATWALEDGTDLKTVSQRLGHAKPLMTATLYGNVTPKLQEDAAQKNEERLSG